MQRVPQIVSERLKAATPAVEHPDADLLAAFSERSLARAERDSVLDHLAHCGECREIIALALPASEPVQQIVRPAHSGWLTWPVLRWGLIAAGLLAIVSFGVMQYQRHSQMTAYNAPHSEAASKVDKALAIPSSEPAENKLQTPPPPAPAEQSDLVSSNAGPAAALTAPPVTHRVQSKGGQMGGTLPSGPRVQWQQNANNQQQAQIQAIPQAKQLRDQQAAANAPATSQAADTSAQAGALSSNLGTPVLESQRIDQQSLQGGHADSRIERIKPAGASTMSASKAALAPDFPPPGGAIGGPLGKNSQYAVSSSTPTNWTISSTGGLQRSFDQGSTWQNVDVNNSPASNLALMKAPSRAKELTNEQVATGGSLANDKENSANAGATKDGLAKKDAAALVFRAVASNGPDVWAGAAGGLLYHSSDAGAHWTRVVPAASGVSLTGEIVSLEFIDPQHGRVVTSIPETWTTSDAGQSWQKQ
jgi:hypothetical protein